MANTRIDFSTTGILMAFKPGLHDQRANDVSLSYKFNESADVTLQVIEPKAMFRLC